MKQSIGDFLLRRLEEAGVRHIFGVAGDYNLELMQQLEDRGKPAWVGNCNELNASYAADGYARLNGLGALIVTNGVGALSAINGVAGAYSEHVPVACVCGSIPARAIQRGDLMHHTLADREKGNFYRAFAEVTTAQAVLSTENAATEIDRLIVTAWRRKLPVYMEMPSDIAFLEIEVPDGRLELTMPVSDGERLRACTQMILDRMTAARAPAFLLDLDTDRFAVSRHVVELAERFQMLPRVFRPDGNAESYLIESVEDLTNVLEAEHAGLVFVEAVMDKYDAPADVIRAGHAVGYSDYGPRGPHFAPDARL